MPTGDIPFPSETVLLYPHAVWVQTEPWQSNHRRPSEQADRLDPVISRSPPEHMGLAISFRVSKLVNTFPELRDDDTDLSNAVR